ncbi:MAG: acetyl-CoA decarbonylase/synthase complex subunit delta [Candidatus Omnitrophica bacterium]|nr:acetyl-CoA decarbonylase/synthase complex subunit delta [Candidatus Omnitrophota bacterium]MBU4589575.1 acetyl-CoA decarbonylase/synthase complex subunit delta [Candidatus Omnitrophota bacterium]
MEKVIEKWQDKIGEVVLGATKAPSTSLGAGNGGTRSRTIKIGGETGIYFIKGEDACPNPPVVAMEVWDMEPQAWPETLKAEFGAALNNPVEWAKMCVEKFSADLICLRLASLHPDAKNASGQDAGKTLENVLKAVSVPLIVLGSGSTEKDNEAMVHCAEAARGENCLFGIATQDNYKTLTAACLSGGHSIISEAPIDINIAKQLNILICDMQFPADKIVIHHATGALGYGLEYTYSIMERTRLAGLSGDKMLAMPLINLVGGEVWRTKEAKTGDEVAKDWGAAKDRGALLETATALAYINAGADILVMYHPRAVGETRKVISDLCGR